jgi:ribosomal protein S18 acetylase RimI-like enzyme
MQIVITRKLPEHLREAAAEVYYEAFRRKFRLLLGAEAKAKAVLAADFNPDYAFVALEGDKVLGIAGIQHDGKHFVALRLSTMQHHLGWLSGLYHFTMMKLFERTQRRGELMMDGIAVAPDARGKGIGTRLLATVLEYARENGFKYVRLDVVNTNPDARRLYEREGFRIVKTSEYGVFTRGLGFTASSEMHKLV